MKCPICGQELKPGKKDPNYLLCYNCKKKFKVPQKKIARREEDDGEDQEEQKYSNIPPKNVRKKREAEMRKAYDEMLAVGDGKKKKTKTKRREEIEDNYDDDYDNDYDDDDYGYEDDEKMSKLPLIILGIAIVIVAALIIFVLLK